MARYARMIQPPAVFGHEVSGVVEEVGSGVESLVPGTPVMVANSAPCGECHYCDLGSPSLCDDLLFWNGAYAEFARKNFAAEKAIVESIGLND